jgi:hypothetical protein
VIRAAITLKLCQFEETGAIVAAMTTSIPEAPGSGRNWDYRYCWLRDAFFVVRALNSLSDVDTMEHYLRYLGNIVGQATDGHLQPVYGIALERRLDEREAPALAGYRGMGPVRVGNQAFEHHQHDVYGNVVLATAQSFFDRRLLRAATEQDFLRLQRVSEQILRVMRPDAGVWELRTRERTTSSALVCWAACDRLARIAATAACRPRAALGCPRGGSAGNRVAPSTRRSSFVESFSGNDVKRALLIAKVACARGRAVRRHGRQVEGAATGFHLFRYASADAFAADHGVQHLHLLVYRRAGAPGRRERRGNSWNMLAAQSSQAASRMSCRQRRHWGNYPQTYCWSAS